MQISEHRINAVNAKKLPEDRPQKRRRYRRPKLTPNVSLQGGQETPKFLPIFCDTDVDHYFSPILFFTHTFYKAFTHTFFSLILFLTHTFYKVFTHSFFHPYFFFTHAFYKVSPILFSPILFSPILFFTHSFFHPYFLESFHPYFISPILFSPMVFTKFSNILLFHPYLFSPIYKSPYFSPSF